VNPTLVVDDAHITGTGTASWLQGQVLARCNLVDHGTRRIREDGCLQPVP
jgi:hypothetical protein